MKNLLLLHGAIGSKEQFSELAAFLNHKCIIHVLDFSGHGYNKKEDNFSIALFAADVLDYLKENNIECIDIFGYSMGGYVTMYLARHHPGKVGRIFTLATKFMWSTEIAACEVKLLDAGKIVEKVPAFAQQLEQRHKLADWKNVLSQTAAMMVEMGENPPLQADDYAAIEHTVQLGIGDSDKMVTLTETVDVFGKLRNGSLLVLPSTQHPFEKVDLARLQFEIEHFFG